ncbi:SDR family oxidoreductase [Haloferax mediterranei ATCC 33500]|uniref:3-beta hydroxysteroid dehydrogenase n=1 Tax=Haloferax mediterranei (strain ATCC 33500 / DSM 1411 / JCM 8866 / NBRC 14739 / NCIMB 2177 / R-4) TaxID=523841 RepID=I3R745_HALMT|nr:SDR family oxidoreductase [Haloferax mediterranei]AFK20055.1 NAD dependent epimerase/dehydratase family protein [Haloferax mediterranei ATCC 33500]AHZ23432.1 3-beta hydroxysteroid dehydrogenase [Haloferax mediterranei ATCC 33500]ELZ99603.1 NAD dependent epimerase/dehydratase family protein [Haloferax mediterranei ATCC 33500]MDX5987193.1 SDR family oxidoreductase [Haloferax mediterranei ATCC 33500]QCQ76499.1 SDR family oxidoreductase [Haloferax mediterranei ATCC 33500]
MTRKRGRVLVAGATGRTGRLVLDALAETPFVVRALTRDSNAKADLRARGADEVVVGDLLEPGDARRAVADVDAVVSTVGVAAGLDTIRGDLVDGVGIENLVDAATASGTQRFVLMSSIGVGDSKDGLPLSLRAILTAAGVLSAKAQSETRLRNAPLDHTIIRPGALTDAPATGEVLVGEGGDSVCGSIPRADVANVLVHSLFTRETEKRTFEIVSRPGLRGRADRVVDVQWTPIPQDESQSGEREPAD